VEARFIEAIVKALGEECGELTGQIIETSRNGPVRHLYRDNGFVQDPDGRWRRTLIPAAVGSMLQT
jgi:hypothetical protein